jgi:aminocarboxymuconate-semialdehyde decarboxylase
MTVVDFHAHVIVPEILRDAAPDEEWRPAIREDEQSRILEFNGNAVRSVVHEFVDIDRIIATQDAAGVDRVVLAPWIPLMFLGADPQESLRRCRIQNDALSGMVRANPDRISGLGGVPLQDPELAVAELREIMAAGDLVGVEIAASVRGTYLGDERFEPFWAAAEETGAIVFIHPGKHGFEPSALVEHYMWNTVGNPLETAITAAHMVMSGVMERHPGLKVQLAHGGGVVMSLRGRLRHGHQAVPAAATRLTESPEDSLRRFYYDTVTHDVELLRDLVAFAGADHVLLGSDYPFDMADPDPAATVRACGFDPDVEAAILGGNAERLLGSVSAGEAPARA